MVNNATTGRRYFMRLRTRLMQAGLPQSQSLVALSDMAYLAWPHFFLICDDWGIFRLDTKTIQATLFPKRPGMTEQRILELVKEYVEAELAEVYLDENKDKWVWLTGWFRNQSKWARDPADCTDPIPPSWKQDGNPMTGKPMKEQGGSAPKQIAVETKDVSAAAILKLADSLAKSKKV